MNTLNSLTQGQGCAVDGTAAAANPLSTLVNQVLGGAPAGAKGQMPRGPMHAGPQGMSHQQSEIERGMAMGLHGGAHALAPPPVGPIGWGQAHPPGDFVREFEQQFRAGPQQQQLLGGPPQNWVQDFERMRVSPMESAYMQQFHGGSRPQAWAHEMARGPRPPSEMEMAWRQQQQEGQKWAAEMAQRKEEPAPGVNDAEATRLATQEMVRVLSQNSRFKDSEFFGFMSQVASGQLQFENNTVVANPNAKPLEAPPQFDDPLAAAWAQAEQAADGGEEAWARAQTQMHEAFASAWGGGDEASMEAAWAKAMQQAGQEAGLGEFDEMGGQLDKAWSQLQTANPGEQPYELATENPYSKSGNAYQEGLVLFKDGRLGDAVLAFQAAVSQDPTHADAWRMLGVVHQENDEDRKAIICLERAVEQDAYHLDALLGLGVSYVNELDHERALKNLKAWVINNPAFHGLEVKQDMYSDGSLMDDVMQLMLKAAEWAPNDPGVHEVLGVLYNVSRDYPSATQAFRRALAARPNDYSLWNKVGATLANGSRSEEAIPAYLRAIELRPGYARAQLNLGISYSNLGDYQKAARSYLKALELSPAATHIWSYLRIACSCMERFDLVELCDKRDVNLFRGVFEF